MTNIYTFKVAGVTFEKRQNYIHYIAQNPGAFLLYRRERKNAFDPNAIKVLAKVPEGKCVQLGYVPKELAEKLAPLLDKNYNIKTNSYAITGGRRFNHGVEVTISVYPKRFRAIDKKESHTSL